MFNPISAATVFMGQVQQHYQESQKTFEKSQSQGESGYEIIGYHGTESSGSTLEQGLDPVKTSCLYFADFQTALIYARYRHHEAKHKDPSSNPIIYPVMAKKGAALRSVDLVRIDRGVDGEFNFIPTNVSEAACNEAHIHISNYRCVTPKGLKEVVKLGTPSPIPPTPSIMTSVWEVSKSYLQ